MQKLKKRAWGEVWPLHIPNEGQRSWDKAISQGFTPSSRPPHLGRQGKQEREKLVSHKGSDTSQPLRPTTPRDRAQSQTTVQFHKHPQSLPCANLSLGTEIPREVSTGSLLPESTQPTITSICVEQQWRGSQLRIQRQPHLSLNHSSTYWRKLFSLYETQFLHLQNGVHTSKG